MTDLEKTELRQIIREELAVMSFKQWGAGVPAIAEPANASFAYAGSPVKLAAGSPIPGGTATAKFAAGSVGQCTCALCGNIIPSVTVNP